jgi:hypothetical protein
MAEKKLCFVIGPIGDEGTDARIHADWLLEGIIEPVMAQFTDFIVKRADRDPRPGLIDAQMINDLLNADLVIADLSFSNPNAFYEIGIRHMAQKPIIHMQLKDEKPPFDLSLYRAIKFSRLRIRDLEEAKTELKRTIDALLAPDYEVENPVTHARGKVKLDEHATSGQKVILDQLDAHQERIEMLEDQLRFFTNPGNAIQSALPLGHRGEPPASTIIGFSTKDSLTSELITKIMQTTGNAFGASVQLGKGSRGFTVLFPGRIEISDVEKALAKVGINGVEIKLQHSSRI